MWYPLGDGSDVSMVPDGWRVRNADGSYHHIRDVRHAWREAGEAVARGRGNAARRDALFLHDHTGWVPNDAIKRHVDGLGLHHIELAMLLRRHGGAQRKRKGVRGWAGIALGKPAS